MNGEFKNVYLIEMNWKLTGLVAVLIIAAGALLYTGFPIQDNSHAVPEVKNETSEAETIPAKAPSQQEATNTSENKVQQENRHIRGYIGLTSQDLPGFIVSASRNRTLNDLTREGRESFDQFGFQNSLEKWLQKPLLKPNEEITREFREVQTTVFIFNNTSGALGYFDKLIQAKNSTFDVIELNIGEKGAGYVETYEDNGVQLEQHYIFFVKRNALGITSVTALAAANITGDLVIEAARKLEEKIN